MGKTGKGNADAAMAWNGRFGAADLWCRLRHRLADLESEGV